MSKKLKALRYAPLAIVATAVGYGFYQIARVPDVNKPQEIRRLEQIDSELSSFEQLRLEDFLNQSKVDSLIGIATSLQAERDSLRQLPYFEKIQSQYAEDSARIVRYGLYGALGFITLVGTTAIAIKGRKAGTIKTC